MPKKGDCIPAIDRFLAKVEKTDGCWNWIGGKFGTDKGVQHRYGCFMISKSRGNILAHRAAWELFVGEIPEGKIVCHKCDHPICVNPEHLFIGTQRDNCRDMAKKKRNFVLHGEDSRFHKITEKDVLHLREIYGQKEGMVKDMIKVAKNMGIGKSQFYNIVSRKCWAHLSLEGQKSIPDRIKI